MVSRMESFVIDRARGMMTATSRDASAGAPRSDDSEDASTAVRDDDGDEDDSNAKPSNEESFWTRAMRALGEDDDDEEEEEEEEEVEVEVRRTPRALVLPRSTRRARALTKQRRRCRYFRLSTPRWITISNVAPRIHRVLPFPPSPKKRVSPAAAARARESATRASLRARPRRSASDDRHGRAESHG